jgi:hypothetical protein
MNAPEGKTIAFLFVSHPAREKKLRWRARLVFPPAATAATALALHVMDADGAPVGEGTFVFAGREIPVRGGRGEMAYADFVAGKHEKALWLRRPGLEPVPGGLSFG